MEDIKLTPMPGWLIVRPAMKKNASGLYLPSSAGEQPQFGVVVACGDILPDMYNYQGLVKVGSTVHFPKWNGMALKSGNEDFLFLKYQEVLAVEK